MTGVQRAIATPSQTAGPFFHFGLASNTHLGCVAPPGADGECMRLRVRVFDGDNAPVTDALIEVYQADASGQYARPAFPGFGRLPTDGEGACVFETIRPGHVADGRGGVQARHINVCVLGRGLLRQVYTRIYFSGDDGHDTDPLLALVPADRRHTLMASRVAGSEHEWEFVIRLQGENETVFFDL